MAHMKFVISILCLHGESGSADSVSSKTLKRSHNHSKTVNNFPPNGFLRVETCNIITPGSSFLYKNTL